MENKSNNKTWPAYIIVPSLSMFMFWFFIYSILGLFVKFSVLSKNLAFLISLIVGVLFGILNFVYIIVALKSYTTGKFENWLIHNFPHLTLFSTIILIIINSIKTEVIWDMERLEKIISLEWTIFGLSIAIFLVWNVIVVDYLKSKIPSKPKDHSIKSVDDYINKKSIYYPQANHIFNSVVLLCLNLFSVLVATIVVYFSESGVTLFNQNITLICFYLCTNSLIVLFIDVIRPINEEKKKIINEMRVSNDEITWQNDVYQQMSDTIITLRHIDKIKGLDEDTKSKIKRELYDNYSKISKVMLAEIEDSYEPFDDEEGDT